jgi:hypothetical protein
MLNHKLSTSWNGLQTYDELTSLRSAVYVSTQNEILIEI